MAGERRMATVFDAQMSFVGRERELAALVGRLAEAGRGHGGVALLAGEAGIGKTRLSEELTALARARDVSVLWGRCIEDGGAPAYWPWMQVLRSLLRTVTPAELPAALGPAAAD